MANRKISDLTSLTAPATGDLLPIVDISEAAAADKNKKITYGELLASAPAGTAAAPSFSFDGDPNTGTFNPVADTLAFAGGGTEVARIDSSGRLLVGLSTARTNFFNTSSVLSGPLQTEGTSNLTRIVSQIYNSNDSGGPILVLGKSRGTTVGSNTVVSSEDVLGQLSFQGSDGTEFVEAASVVAVVDGTPGANDMPGRLMFSTTADGAASSTERMRIDSAGRVLVGTSTANTSGAKLQTSDGLTFPATAVASADPNTLDDYEEGTWTPTIIGSSTAGTATYTTRVSDYVKIGKQVTFNTYIDWSAGTGTGSLQVAGLPFTVGSNYYSVCIGYIDRVTFPALSIATAYAFQGATRIEFYTQTTGGGAVASIAYDGVGAFMLTGTYFIA